MFADYDYDSFNLGHTADEVILTSDGSTVDEVWYDEALFPDTGGKVLNLSASAFDHNLNDDGANWCDATGAYGEGDLGTPGGSNPECPGE